MDDNFTPLPEKVRNPNGGGRPTIMTDETLNKLRTGFLMGFSDREACAYAEISHQTLYNYQAENPKFVDQKEAWKENPILKAKATIYKSLEDKDTAKWYLERKRKDEFSSRQEHTGADGEGIKMILDKIETNYDTVAEQARQLLNENNTTWGEEPEEN